MAPVIDAVQGPISTFGRLCAGLKDVLILTWYIDLLPLLIDTFHAKPASPRNFVKLNAVCMICSVAAIAEEQYLLLVCLLAYDARSCRLLFFLLVVHKGTGVELGHLYLVFDGIFG